VTKLLAWFARILAFAGILFISLFALDVPVSEQPWDKTATAIFVHLLPSAVLIACLVIAWRKPWLGGILFVLAGFSPFALLSNPPWINLMLGGPFLLAGLFFCASYVFERNPGRQG